MLNLFDISINLVESIALTLFVMNSLTFNKNKKIYYFILTLLIFIEICIANIFLESENLYAVVYFLTIFSVSRMFSSSANQDIAIISIVSLMITSLANITSLFIITSITSLSVSEMTTYYPETFMIAIILSKLLLFFIQLFVSKAYKKIFVESTKFFGEFITILFLSRTSFIVLESMLFTQDNNQKEIFTAVLLESLIVTLLIYIYYKVQNDNRINMRKLKKYSDITSYKEHFDSIRTYNNEIKIINHDLKNTMNILQMYIIDDKKEDALTFIKKKFDIVSSAKYLIETDIDIINLILNKKKQLAESKGIRMDIKIDIKSKPDIDNLELISLLGNALDNAIEHIGSKRVIKLTISSFGSQSIIKICNTVDSSVLGSNPKLKTTKIDKDFHGLGIISMKETICKHGGTINFTEEHGYFICTIMLSL